MNDHLDWPTLNDLIDGHLDERQTEEARRHCESCASCRQRLARLDRSVEASGELREDVPAPGELWDEIRRSTFTRTTGTAAAAPWSGREWRLSTRAIGIAAAVLV